MPLLIKVLKLNLIVFCQEEDYRKEYREVNKNVPIVNWISKSNDSNNEREKNQARESE
jgi:hypothetical protein